jgi:hypothetical protein
MNSWMKRRINRSRARCHKILPGRKQKARREQLEEKTSSQPDSARRASSHTPGDK